VTEGARESARVASGMDPSCLAPTDLRVGILGGTFDPIHFGHLVIAEQVREALSLDRVLFIPAFDPPHKPEEGMTPAEARAEMAELAIAGNPRFAVSRIELAREGVSYTADTLGALVAEADAAGIARQFHFIMSTETLAQLQTWHDPSRLLSQCRLAVVPRPGWPLPDEAGLRSMLPAGAAPDIVDLVHTVPLANSASDVRRRAAAGNSIRYLVPPEVEAYIHEHGLYRPVSTGGAHT
jgi:nicotinate-nucleotide adenylyltransferase